jgi:hypothetical protein
MTLGEQLSPILSEIQDTLLDHDIEMRGQPKFTKEGFTAGIYIFQSVLLDKMWDMQEQEGMDLVHRMEMAEYAGTQIKKLVLEMTNIDTFKLYK